MPLRRIRSGHFVTAMLRPSRNLRHTYSPVPSIMGVKVRTCNPLSGSSVTPSAA